MVLASSTRQIWERAYWVVLSRGSTRKLAGCAAPADGRHLLLVKRRRCHLVKCTRRQKQTRLNNRVCAVVNREATGELVVFLHHFDVPIALWRLYFRSDPCISVVFLSHTFVVYLREKRNCTVCNIMSIYLWYMYLSRLGFFPASWRR